MEIVSFDGAAYMARDDLGQLWIAGEAYVDALGQPNPDTGRYEQLVKVDTALTFSGIHSDGLGVTARTDAGDLYMMSAWTTGSVDGFPMVAAPDDVSSVLASGEAVNSWGDILTLTWRYDPVSDDFLLDWENQGKPPRFPRTDPLQSCEWPS